MTVTVRGKLFDKYSTYAQLTSTSFKDAVIAALDEWMETCGEAEMEVITGIPAPEVKINDQPTYSLMCSAGTT